MSDPNATATPVELPATVPLGPPAGASSPAASQRTSGDQGKETAIDVNDLLLQEKSEIKRTVAAGEDKSGDPEQKKKKKKKGKKKGDGDDQKKEVTDEEKKQKKEEDKTVGNFFKILGYGTPLDKTMQIIGAIAAAGAGATFPLIALPFGDLATSMTAFMTPGQTQYSPHEFRQEINKLCLIFVYLFIGKLVLGYIALLFFRTTGTRLSSAIRLRYLSCLFVQPISFFDASAKTPTTAAPTMTRGFGTTGSDLEKGSGSIVVAITSSSNTVQAGISEKMGLFIQSLSMLIAAFIVAFTKNWELTLITALILPASVLVYGITIPMDIALEKKVNKAYTQAATIAEETLSTVRTVKAFNAQEKLISKYHAELQAAKRVGLKKTPITGIQSSAAFFVIYAGYGLCFWYGIRMFQQGKLENVGEIFTVFFAVLIGVIGFANIAPPIGIMSKAAAAAAEMFEVIDRSGELVLKKSQGRRLDAEEGIIDSKTGKKWSTRLEFRNINFAYPTRPDVKILNGMNVVFEEGKTTAIVGSSGSGKSTIVGLLERWYDPEGSVDDKGDDRGQLLVSDGVDIRDLNVKWWRGQIGLVQQEPMLFNDTIFKNVCYGLIGSPWENSSEEEKRAKVREACDEAGAQEFIEQLPEGYDTKVGEQGVKLSGGQKQRIAIARSIIKQPPILILDEATSAIDPRNERIVQDALDKVSKSRTTIMIAHRLSTVQKADKIVVMGKGNIVEQGTHDELLQIEGGMYRRLVEGQKLLMESREGDNVLEGDDADWEGADLGRRVTTKSVASAGKTKTDLEVGEVDKEELSEQQKMVNKLGTFRCLGIMLWEQREHWFTYVLAIFSCILGGASYPVQAIMFAKFTSAFSDVSDMDEFVKTGNFWALMFFILALGVLVAYGILGATFTRLQHHLTSSYRMEYFESVLRQPISFFDKDTNSTGTLTSLLNSDPSALQELLGTNLGMLMVALVSIISCSILALIVGWKLSLVCLVAAVPLTISSTVFRVRIELNFEKDVAAVFSESSQFAAEAVGAFRTVTSLTLEDSIAERYRVLLDNHVKNSFNKQRFAMIFFSASECVNFLSMALTFWYGGQLISKGELDVEKFFIIYIALIQGGEAAGQFFAFTPNMAAAQAAAHRILGLREPNPPPPGNPPAFNSDGGCEVEFRDVRFKYKSRDTPVFKGLSLKIERGQFAAFVGASGCGKTTTISLLERFYDIDSGQILIDGQPLNEIDITAYRQMASLVAQEPTLYQGTLLDNVRLGVSPETPEEDVIQACKEAYIHDFISSLPEGYRTECGNKGIGLSGGQKQRVAIARALIRNPKILLLDEATSSLDSTSEKIVQEAFEKAAKGRTMIAVAHRLSTIQKADVIFVFDEGRIVEQGTHLSLLRKRGVYYQMCQAQALDR